MTTIARPWHSRPVNPQNRRARTRGAFRLLDQRLQRLLHSRFWPAGDEGRTLAERP